MPGHIKRWKDEFYKRDELSGIKSMKYWREELNYIKDYAEKRPGEIRRHLINQFGLNGTVDLTINCPNGNVEINRVRINDQEFFGSFFKNIPIKLKALPLKGYRFLMWKGDYHSEVDSIELAISNSTVIEAVFIPTQERKLAEF